jgi:hypothetical protein
LYVSASGATDNYAIYSIAGTVRFSDAIEGVQIATPANPPASSNKLYFKSDNNLYMLNSAGTETQVNGGGGSVSGSGTTGKIPKWSAATALTDSLLSESGTVITIAADLAASANNTWDLGTTGTRFRAGYFTEAVANGVALGITAKTANYTATASDYTVLVDATSGAVTITIPNATSFKTGKIFTVKKTDASANNVSISIATGTVDGAASITWNTQYQSYTIQSDGTNWYVI